MKLWLVRHAIAVEADEFDGSDMDRPLTSKGRKSARAAFKRFASLRDRPDMIVSSKAVRAVETARIFADAFGISRIEKTERLNPGCRFKDIKKVVQSLPVDVAVVALVGHEPDFSDAVSRFTSGGELQLVLKKGGIAELNVDASGHAVLLSLLTPELLGG